MRHCLQALPQKRSAKTESDMWSAILPMSSSNSQSHSLLTEKGTKRFHDVRLSSEVKHTHHKCTYLSKTRII